MTAEPVQVLLAVVRRLDELGITYAVGGSLSSSVFGEPRASADVDILVAIAPKHAHAVAIAFADEFYVDEDAIVDAARRKSSFNVIHLGTMLKVDLFVASDDLLDREQLRRKVLVIVERAPPQTAFITAPENIVLRKLDWFRRGGGVSDQQWRDILGVMKAQAPTLDLEYLRNTATHVGLEELLVRALSDAGLRLR